MSKSTADLHNVVDSLFEKGPTENLSDQKPNPGAEMPPPPARISGNDDSSVLPLSQSTDPKFADKPFNPNDFNRLKGEPEVEVKKDPALEKEEKEAAEREAKLAEQEKLKKESSEAKIKPPEEKKDDKETKDKLPIKPLKDISRSKEESNSTDKQGQRDFTGFDESELGPLKKMSNEAFEFVRPRLLAEKESKNKIKELETQLAKRSSDALPESYLEHPEAYLLDKRYKQSVENIDTVAKEMNAWEEALIKARGGEEWVEYQWDSKNQRYVGIKRPPGREAERYIERAIQKGQSILQETEGTIKQVMQEHNIRSTKLRESIRERENAVFPDYADPEIIKKDPVMKQLADYLGAGGLENNPLLPTCCKFYAHSLKLQTRIEELEAGSTKDKTIAEVRKQNGPTNGEVNSGAAGLKDTTVKSKDEIPYDPNAFEKYRS